MYIANKGDEVPFRINELTANTDTCTTHNFIIDNTKTMKGHLVFGPEERFQDLNKETKQHKLCTLRRRWWTVHHGHLVCT